MAEAIQRSLASPQSRGFPRRIDNLEVNYVSNPDTDKAEWFIRMRRGPKQTIAEFSVPEWQDVVDVIGEGNATTAEVCLWVVDSALA